MNIEISTVRGVRGFTMIEVVVVVVFLSILSGAAIQGFAYSARKAREAMLREELSNMRAAVDRYYLDRLREAKGATHFERFPESLWELVEKRYIRSVPFDPVLGAATWEVLLVAPGVRRIFDVRSMARGVATDGTFYTGW